MRKAGSGQAVGETQLRTQTVVVPLQVRVEQKTLKQTLGLNQSCCVLCECTDWDVS